MTHVLIVGAGIGGLTAALDLAQRGVAVTLIERSPELAEVGAGLQVSPNASGILSRLGVLDAVQATGSAPRAIVVRDARSAATLARLPLAGAEQRWGAPFLVVHRADLQRVLFAAVVSHSAIAFHPGTALAGFGVTATGVAVTAKCGRLTRSFEADALIGADGIRSSVRARLVEAAGDTPMQTGRTAWRALVPASSLPALFKTEETGLWLGPNAHLVHYSLRRGALINVVAVIKEHAPDPDTGTAQWAIPGDPSVIAQRFAGWHHQAKALIAAAPSWQGWPLFDRAALPAWNAGPVALLGDAAHPILPFLAQGASQAIEDAEALADAIAGQGSIADQLAAYSSARVARATRVQETARQLGVIYHMKGPLALARNMTMRGLGGERLLARYDWLYRPSRPQGQR